MRKRTLLPLLLGTLLAGCANLTVKTGSPPTAAPIKKDLTFYIWGLVGTEEIDLRALCPTGVASIHQQATFGDMCLSLITLGIYTPRTVEITCSSGAAYQLDVDAEGRVTRLAHASAGAGKAVIR
jgi:hypothetical protein